MKKFLAILLGAIFVLSFAATAFAIHAEIPSETQAVVAKGTTQITIDGDLRVRGWYTKNIDAAGFPVDSTSHAWYDERIRLGVDAKVSPNVEGYIQLESGNEAGSPTTDNWAWGTPGFNSMPGTTPRFLQAWLMYSGQGLFGFPSGLKIGHMPLYLGQKQFFDHSKFGDDAIVFFMVPTKELEIDLLTIKFIEGAKLVNGDDLDGYVGILTYKWDPKNTVGLNYTYLNQSSSGLKESNIELVANGDISGFTYKASLDFQFGDKAEGVKAKGYGIGLGLGYMFDPVNLRLSAAYGSGSEDGTGEKQFDTFLGSDQTYTLVYDYNVATAAGALHTGISNTAYLNLGIDFAATKDLTASLDGYIIRAAHANPAIAGSSDKDAGWEADARVKYNIAKNLTYQVDAGYFKAGDLYGPDNKGATVLKHAIELSF
ncbi:MAG: alginate export family protein [Acidobacteriota bacterium]